MIFIACYSHVTMGAVRRAEYKESYNTVLPRARSLASVLPVPRFCGLVVSWGTGPEDEARPAHGTEERKQSALLISAAGADKAFVSFPLPARASERDQLS